MKKKYSVDEIARMRAAVETMTSTLPFEDRATATEVRLCTYMLNGTTPEELEEAVDQVAHRMAQILEEARGILSHPGPPAQQ